MTMAQYQQVGSSLSAAPRSQVALASCLEVSQVRTVEKGDWGSMGGGLGSHQSKEETPSANAVILPLPHPQEIPDWGKWE